MNYVQKASTLTKNTLKNSSGKCKNVDVHFVKVKTLHIKTSLLKKFIFSKLYNQFYYLGHLQQNSLCTTSYSPSSEKLPVENQQQQKHRNYQDTRQSPQPQRRPKPNGAEAYQTNNLITPIWRGFSFSLYIGQYSNRPGQNSIRLEQFQKGIK